MTTAMTNTDTPPVPTDPTIRFRMVETHAPHSVTGDYVRRWWCSVVGPTAILALISLASSLARPGAVVCVPASDLGSLLGVGTGTAKNAVLMRAINRLVKFNLVTQDDDGVLNVPTHLRPLDCRYVDRLTDRLRYAHRRLYDTP